MKSDEDQIRELVSTWMEATRTRDVDSILRLMTDDAVFLVPGRPVMRKADFAAAARAQAAGQGPQFDGRSEIQEVQVFGDWAFMWGRLTVVSKASDGHESNTRSGHTLTVLHRQEGQWLLARDANLLGPPDN
jgi:uncharacterized protein (TIGR02246 family)